MKKIVGEIKNVKEYNKITNISPIEFIENMCGLEFEHIKFDKDVVPQYHIIRESIHDGTYLFTYNLMAETLGEIIKMTTCYNPTKPENEENVKFINYIVGEVEVKSLFKDGRQIDVVNIPVKCDYIMFEEGEEKDRNIEARIVNKDKFEEFKNKLGR